jgi:predicted NBD/HSP70 family sugar kinase
MFSIAMCHYLDVVESVSPSTTRELRTASLLRVLRAVHHAPAPPTRVAVTRELGLGRGTATVLVAALKQRRLLTEGEAGPRQGPGRPTAHLLAHPDGPVALAAAITHDGWTLDAVEFGARVLRTMDGGHDSRHTADVLDRIREAAATVMADLPGRVRTFALSLPATVRGDRVAQASLFGWTDLDALAPFTQLDIPMTLVNDATAAGIAEARRGAARGREVVLHLHADAGIGGTLLINGMPVRDAQGAGGEFGHMPLGGGQLRCHCGAYGCWDLDVGNLALVGGDDPTPRPSVRQAAARVLDRATAGDPAALARVADVATALGRGIGALVNGHDPQVVTLSGVAATIADLAGPSLRRAYLDALMLFRRAAAPPLRLSTLGPAGQRLGTAELAFDLLLTASLVDSPRLAHQPR